MRSLTPMVTAAVLVTGPGVPAGTAGATATAPVTSREHPAAAGPAGDGADTIPTAWKNVTSLRVLPRWPRQAGHVRVVGRDSAPLRVRRFSLRRFFDR